MPVSKYLGSISLWYSNFVPPAYLWLYSHLPGMLHPDTSACFLYSSVLSLHGWPVQCLLLNCWWNNGSLFLYFLLTSAFSSPLLYWTVLSSSFSGLTTLYPLSDNTPLSRSDHVLFPGFFCNYLFHGSLLGTLRLKSILVHLQNDVVKIGWHIFLKDIMDYAAIRRES